MSDLFEMQIDFLLSDELVRDIRKSVIENKFKLLRTDVEEVKQILDEQVYMQLLSEMYESFIRSHLFFTEINMNILPKLERIITYIEITDILYYVNKLASDVYFLIDGKIKLKDRNQNVVAEFEKDSIIGVEEFKALTE